MKLIRQFEVDEIIIAIDDIKYEQIIGNFRSL